MNIMIIYNLFKRIINYLTLAYITNKSSVRRSLLLAIGPCPVLKEVPLGTKDYGGRVIPTRNRALTAKKIEVKPYKWIQELDKMTDENGNRIYLGALTEKMFVQQGSNEQIQALKDLWWAGRESNPHSLARTRF